MMAMLWFTAVAAVVLSLFVYRLSGALSNYRKLKQFQGPPLAGYSRLWLFWQSVNARVYIATDEALAKYGSPARIGPDLLVINGPDRVRHFNAPGSGWRRSGWYEAMRFDPRQDSVFSTRDEQYHAILRALQAGGYNGRDLAETLHPRWPGVASSSIAEQQR